MPCIRLPQRALLLGCVISIVMCACHASRAQEAKYRLATFSADVTIPLGHRCMGVLPTKSKKIVDPLYAHGFVLLGSKQPIVLCAVDWCEIRNGAYDQWRDALAKAAGTTRERVLVCSLHQHDAPVVDSGAAKLLADVGLKGELYDEAFHDRTVQRVAAALADSLQEATPITHFGLGQARVEKVASNRRVVDAAGRVQFGRSSRSGANEFYSEADEGRIDPFLKTIAFYNGEAPVVELHAYATHPMSYYGRGEVSSDFVGLARGRRQRDDFSVKQIYVSGCSGDVTAGKYNDGSQDSRLALTDRMYQALVASSKSIKRSPIERFEFRSTNVELEYDPRESLTEKSLAAVLNDEQRSVEDRILAAMGLSSRRRVAAGQKIDVPCIDFGKAQIVLFPAEAFVGYQLLAQKMRPDSFVVSIGYGECWPGYIPLEESFADKFDDKWLWVCARFGSADASVAAPAVVGR